MGIAEYTLPALAAEFEAQALLFLPGVARYARLLTGEAADADDLTQETFLRAFENWHQFRPGTDCRKWLFAICRNLYLRERQRSRRFVPVDLVSVDDTADERPAHAMAEQLSRVFDRIDVGPALQRAIQRLPSRFREALVLVDVEDRTYDEAATLLGVPIGTIRSRLFRARRLLQQSVIEHARDSCLPAAPKPERRSVPSMRVRAR